MNPAVALGAIPVNQGQGAHTTGVYFSLYSSQALAVKVAIYDPGTCKLKSIQSLQKYSGDIWKIFTQDACIGDYYVYHVSLKAQLKVGYYYNYRHGLIDPYAKKIIKTQQRCGLPELVGVVCEPFNTVSAESKPPLLWQDTVIYEAHVKGLTMLNPHIPEHQRGKYLGVCHPSVIDHLKSLGVTTLELMPCQAMIDEPWLAKKGLTNYWGYNPISFMAPTQRYAIKDSVSEFKAMVAGLHSAGLEVIVDLVFNHTAEGDLNGPVISLKGIDPHSYYLMQANNKEPFVNYTGCGNTLNAMHPRVIQLWMDALRYWYNELGVDGFRFDLGVTLGRNKNKFEPCHAFFIAIQQDPDLRHAKLIFEPWDLGPNGYQIGKFPAGFAEWNGSFRDTVRAYVRGDGGALREFTTQFVSSFDRHFTTKGREEAAINFVTAHDGFTLHDLVSYQDKHNQDNGENNRDGSNHNLSRNYGVEGETNRTDIQNIRRIQKKNFLTILCLAKGIPMLLMGDEVGRTQYGNNNTYCQDNEINWLSWQVDELHDLREFWTDKIELRQEFSWIYQPGVSIGWHRPDAKPMEQEDWNKWYARSVGCSFKNKQGDHLFIIFNMHDGEIEYKLPYEQIDQSCKILFDTSKDEKTHKYVSELEDVYLSSPHSITAFLKTTKD